MPTFPLRFTLTAPGAPARQNPARCVAVEASAADLAIARVVAHYAARGRNPRVYAIEIDGVWRRVAMRAFCERSPPYTGRLGDITGEAPEILGPIVAAAPMAAETPAWATGAPARPHGDKLARIEAMAADLAPTPSGGEAARILAGLRAALAADPGHRLEGRFKKMKALARAEGLWSVPD